MDALVDNGRYLRLITRGTQSKLLQFYSLKFSATKELYKHFMKSVPILMIYETNNPLLGIQQFRTNNVFV